MYGLDVIISRNAQAAGREAGHADNDDNDRLASAIQNTCTSASAGAERTLRQRIAATCLVHGTDLSDFNTGYLRGRSE
jgi:hypothetical protein